MKTAIIAAVILLVLAVGIGAAVFVTPTPATPPVPAGQASVLVHFENLSTDEYNQVFAFIRTLAEENARQLETANKGTIPALMVSSGFHGYFNDGFMDQQYEPRDAAPSPGAEQAMRDKLDAFLKSKSIDPDDVKLELRYGS